MTTLLQVLRKCLSVNYADGFVFITCRQNSADISEPHVPQIHTFNPAFVYSISSEGIVSFPINT